MRLFGARYKGESSGQTSETLSFSEAMPVTAAEVRGYLRYGSNSEDDIITNFIKSAILNIEKRTGQIIVNKTILTTWDTFANEEELPYWPVNKIETVNRAYNGADTELTVNNGYNLSGVNRKTVRVNAVYMASGYYGYGLKVSYQAGHLIPVSATHTTNLFTLVGHPLSDGTDGTNGDVVTVSTYGDLPTGLTAGKRYYVINKAEDTFQLSESVGGDPVDITTDGTGQLYIGTLNERLRQLIIKQAAVYFGRGEAHEGLSHEVEKELREHVW